MIDYPNFNDVVCVFSSLLPFNFVVLNMRLDNRLYYPQVHLNDLFAPLK